MKIKHFVFLFVIISVFFGTGCGVQNPVSTNDVPDKVKDTAQNINDSVQNFTDQTDEHVLMVKSGYPVAIPQITYGQAFEEFFSYPTWNYFLSTDDRDVVEFTGNCIYRNKEVKARLQFVLNMSEGTFQQHALEFNGVPQSNLITSAMVFKAFSEYAKKHNIKIENSAESSLGGDDTQGEYSQNSQNNDSDSDNNYSDDEEDEDYSDEDYSDYDSEDSSYESNDDEYILPHSDYAKITKSDLEGLSAKELTYARNEIYARHGYVFDSNELQSYFESMSWYEADYSFSGKLPKLEQKNANFILKYQESNGLKYKPS